MMFFVIIIIIMKSGENDFDRADVFDCSVRAMTLTAILNHKVK